MLRTLLASTSLSLLLLLAPAVTYGPIKAPGISGSSVAMAAGLEVDIDDDDEDDDCEDWEDDCDDDD